jgi:hypothetical protein
VQRAGIYHVKVRWSPYWRASEGCVSRMPDGSLAVNASHRGFLTLAVSVGVRSALGTLTGLAPKSECTK